MEILSEEEGVLALDYARRAILSSVTGEIPPLVQVRPPFDRKCGVFVTLTHSGCLRGCIGFPTPILPLGEAIVNAAVSAAREDPRFPPVQSSEIASLEIDLTLLTTPLPVVGNPELRPHKIVIGFHGLMVLFRERSGLLLPQVATECGWDSVTFLSQVCLKAGLPAHAWRWPDLHLLTFSGQIFHGKLQEPFNQIRT